MPPWLDASRTFDILLAVSQPRRVDEMTARLLDALEMWEDGMQIMRENLRRRSTHATDEEIESALARWLEGPDDVDSNYVRVGWPRPRR
jgi:hypothetical protein